MNRQITTIVFAILAGFSGGALAPHLLRIAAVHAQDSKPAPDVVQGKTFILLDGSGRKRGEWTLDNSGEPVLQFFDEQGRPIWEAGKVKVRPLSR